MTHHAGDSDLGCARKVSFRAGNRVIHIVSGDPPSADPDQDQAPPVLGPPGEPPIRLGIRLETGELGEVNLDKYIEKANKEGRDIVIHIKESGA